MARTYLDLLTLPLGNGGFDTPSRLALVGSSLGYTTLGILGPPSSGRQRGNPGVDVLRVGRHASRTSRKCDLTVAWGRAAKQAAFRGDVGFVIPDPRDAATVRVAAENEVPVAHSYARVLAADSTRRTQLLREWNQVHLRCRKHGCLEFLVSGAERGHHMRDPRDAAAMVGSWLGLGLDEALEWLTDNPQAVLSRAGVGGTR